jgi:predicted NAD-dependent protein-ADP-ribosyltransferase YbiA (DUF1768 family)
MDVINFYRVSDKFGQFSNLAPFPIKSGRGAMADFRTGNFLW